MLKNTPISHFINAHNNKMENARNLSMVFCTSEINNNILMWSHYANCHKGICLGICMPSLITKIDCFTLKVNYADSIIPKRFYTPDKHERVLALMYWIFTKASCWGYEKEVRSVITNEDNQLIITEDKYCDIKLPKSHLKEIYFGLESSQKDIDDLKKIIKQKGYEIPIIKKMKKIKGQFALTAV